VGWGRFEKKGANPWGTPPLKTIDNVLKTWSWGEDKKRKGSKGRP